MDDLNTYNGDPMYDVEVDYDFHINTGELPDVFGDSDLDKFNNNLNY